MPEPSHIDALPIDDVLDDVVRVTRERGFCAVEAAPGAGKTSRVPPALWRALASEPTAGGVFVLEPRRLAARMAAARVAKELGETLGGTVGYQVRFDARVGDNTRVRFLTEGVLPRLMAGDPDLRAARVVVLDEIHERDLHGDIALALLLELKKRRDDLALVLMSATFDGARLARHAGFDESAVVRCSGRVFPVETSYLKAPLSEPLDLAVATAVRGLARKGLDGHVLVFLPGAREIREAIARCQPVARDHDLELLPLHGALPADEQDRAVAPSQRRKVVLATNVAESSITIDGVAAVIDSGLQRTARHHRWSGLGELSTEPISKASATQRAGRAGRTRAGQCLRLYTEQDFRRRADAAVPELLRADLSAALLLLSSTGVRDPSTLPWLDPPAPEQLHDAQQLLTQLQAIDPDGALSTTGKAMLRFGVAPRLARVLVEAERVGVFERAAWAVAILADRGSLRQHRRGDRGNAPLDPSLDHELELVDAAIAARFRPRELNALGIDTRRARNARELHTQLLRRRRSHRRHAASTDPSPDPDRDLSLALLSGFGDRVGKRTASRGRNTMLALSHGGRAEAPGDTATGHEGYALIVAARERPNQPAFVTSAWPFDGALLFEAAIDQLDETEQLVMNEARGRVERLREIRYGQLVLESERSAAPASEQATAVLLAAIEHDTDADEAWQRWLTRVRFAATVDPQITAPSPQELQQMRAEICAGMTRADEVQSIAWPALIEGRWPAAARKALARVAPDSVRVGEHALTVHYPADRDPEIESYLQDFFGLTETPCIGSRPLLLKLWAPNRRPIQVTKDLPGFWQRHYPTLKKELSRRYPKHHWPDAPTSAPPVRLKRHLTEPRRR